MIEEEQTVDVERQVKKRAKKEKKQKKKQKKHLKKLKKKAKHVGSEDVSYFNIVLVGHYRIIYYHSLTMYSPHSL